MIDSGDSRRHFGVDDVYVESRDFREIVAVWMLAPAAPGSARSILQTEAKWYARKDDELLDPSVRPTLELTGREALMLMDALWAAGVRPSKAKRERQDETVEAIGRHLEDMRALAFAKLDVVKP